MESQHGRSDRLTLCSACSSYKLTDLFTHESYKVQGGKYDLELTLPPNYPFKPPTVTFKTKIYHPNVSNDSPPNSGMMCLGMLRDSEWKPSTKMNAVLEFIRQLLREPDPDDAVEAKIAEQYKDDKPGYEKEAKDWTRRYASGKK